MATSLAEQLKRLARPQTSLLVDLKQRPSIIFDKKEAANKDRETIYEIGANSLEELIALNPNFQQFETTLFDRSSKDLERAVENVEVNKYLDKVIRKFMLQLSPYFMLQPSHKCLEWLIRRFHIESFNKEELMMLILPFYETRIFVKCLQIMNLSDPSDKWHWLKPVQKLGLPLSKQTLFNHAANDSSFLQFISRTIIDAVKELDTRAYTLQVLFGFYSTTVIGALENINYVNETHVTNILPSLLKGLSSNVIDFTASTYMILGQLLIKSGLSPKTLNKLIIKIMKVQHQSLYNDSIMLLTLIYQTQGDHLKVISDEALASIVANKWVASNLGLLSSQGIKVSSVYIPLLSICLRKVQLKSDNIWTNCKDFCKNLLLDVVFTDEEAEFVIRCALNNYVLREKNNDVITIDSDDENDIALCENNVDVSSWYSNFLKKLERQYPQAFDKVVKQIMQGNTEEISDSRKSALKAILGFLLKVSHTDGDTNIFENLYHHQSKFRVEAVKYLVKNFDKMNISPESSDLIRDSIGERLMDDNPKVVEEALKFSTTVLLQLIGKTELINKFVIVLNKCENSTNLWHKVKLLALKHLTDEEIWESANLTKIFLIIFPYIFPTNKEELEAAIYILNSSVGQKIPFIAACSKNISSKDLNNDIDVAVKVHKLLESSKAQLPKVEDILKTIDDFNMELKNLQIFYTLLLIINSCNKNCEPNISAAISKIIQNFYQDATAIEWEYSDMIARHCQIRENRIPIDFFIDSIPKIITLTDFSNMTTQKNDMLDFSSQTPTLRMTIQLFEWLIGKCYSQKENESKNFNKLLIHFLNTIFPTFSAKMVFLSNFFVQQYNEDVTSEDNLYKITPELQLQAISLMNCILEKTTCNFNLDSLLLIRILIGLSNDFSVIRKYTLITLNIIKKLNSNNEKYSIFLKKITHYPEELEMDCEQIGLILYNILSPDRGVQKAKNAQEKRYLRELLDDFLDLIVRENTSKSLQSKILKILQHINNSTILTKILPCVVKILIDSQNVEHDYILDCHQSAILRNIILRFNQDTIKTIQKSKDNWEITRKILTCQAIMKDEREDKLTSPSTELIDAFDAEMFKNLTIGHQKEFLHDVIKLATFTNSPAIVSSVGKLMKRLDLNATLTLDILTSMQNPKSKDSINDKNKNKNDFFGPSYALLLTEEWKMGVTLLEFLQNKKKLEKIEVLLPILFNILKKCVAFEEQSSVEYTKQMILACLLYCCQKISPDGSERRDIISDNVFRTDLIVQCIRASQNPQTHHHALQLLCHTSSMLPEQVLHNIMEIFTFMGSSVVRQDDAYSLQIISNIVETIIPILIQSNKDESTEIREKLVVPVLKVFCDIILDVPEHRRLPLYVKLIQTLGPNDYFWMFLGALFESQVVHGDQEKSVPSKRKELVSEFPRRFEIALAIAKEFEPTIVLVTCTKLIDFLRRLPVDEPDTQNIQTLINAQLTDATIFNTNVYNSKQLRHFKYIIVQFISLLTSSTQFVNKIAAFNDEDLKRMKSYYQNIIIKILMYIAEVSKAADQFSNTNQQKYWKVMLHHCYDILDNTISLLSADTFLIVVHGLMQHKLSTVRRKIIELLIHKLQNKFDFFEKCDDSNLLKLLEPLQLITERIVNRKEVQNTATVHETIIIEQMSLIAIKLLSKLLAGKYPNDFKNILDLLVAILKKRNEISMVILATVILCIAELCANLKAHAITGLSLYVPAFLDILKYKIDNLTIDSVLISIVTGLQKIIETLPLFLSPYLGKIIILISLLSAKLEKLQEDTKVTPIRAKVLNICQKISSVIPLRLLVPAVEKAYTKLVTHGDIEAIAPLMAILSESFNNIPGNEIAGVQTDLSNFFLKSLEFRTLQSENEDNKFDAQEIDVVEERIIKALVVLILKLSESSFKPFYYKVYDWAIRESSDKDRVITFYRLSNNIADALKSLFVLFAADFVQNAADVLNACNLMKQENPSKLYFPNDTKKCQLLIENIIQTLTTIFTYNNKKFVTRQRFEILIQPVVDQLENSLILQDSNLMKIVTICIATLGAAANDNQWNQLNYQILLKTRHNKPSIRLFAINTCVEFARKLGEDFQSLLPETIPFLSELMEDENDEVENGCQKNIVELESILGESLQKYF